MNNSIPEFKEGDKVRFYYTDYKNRFCNMVSSGILVEIYNKETQTYWNLEYYPINNSYIFRDKAHIACYESNVHDNMETYQPIYYYQPVYDFSKEVKIKYTLRAEQAEIINSYLKNHSYPKYFRWFNSSDINTSNDWSLFCNIFDDLDRHVNGSFMDRLDTIA